MDPVSSILILKSLDGLAARSRASAQNIANAGTPGYRPVRVTFEAALRAAAPLGAAEIGQVQPRMEQAPIAPWQGQAMRLDLELATAASTAGRYGALIELLTRQMQLDSTAISGGR